MSRIHIKRVMCDVEGSVLPNAIRSVRVVQETRIVGGGDFYANLMTRVPDVGGAPEVDLDVVDMTWFD